MNVFLLALLVMAAGALLSGAVALLPTTLASNRAANRIGAAAAAVSCLLGLTGLFSGGWESVQTLSLPWGLPFGAMVLGLDPLSRLFLLPVFVLGITCALSGAASMRHSVHSEHCLGAHWLFYLLLLAGMTCVMTARDGIFFMLSWELMSLSPLFLIDFNYQDWKVQEASWVYLVAAHLGAVLLIAFFALLWQENGSSLFDVWAAGAPAHSTALFLLALLGFGAKAGLAPLHVWLPEAHPAAPSHVSALLSGAMLNAGLYGIIRSFDFLGPVDSFPAWWGWVLMGFGICTGIMGILKALSQTNLKRLLAYSSVENMGLMVMGVGIGFVGARSGSPAVAALGFGGCLFHMINHSAFKGLLFLCAGEVLHSTGTVNMAALGGLQKRLPLVGILFALGAASIACLPPFNGFAGEFVVAMSLVQGLSLSGMEQKIAMLACLVGLMLVSGVSAFVYIKAYGMTFLGQPRSQFAINVHAPLKRFLTPLCIPAAICVAGGLGAGWLFGLVGRAVSFVPVPAAGLADQAVADAAAAEAAGILGATAGQLFAIAAVSGAGIVLVGLLFLLRRGLLAGRVTKTGPTWGCGYQYGTPRMQYTPASFSEPASRLFGAGMGTLVQSQKPEGYFPGPAWMLVKAPDAVRTRLYEPLFAYIQQGCHWLKRLQNGLVNIYILYILVTLIVLLIWGMA